MNENKRKMAEVIGAYYPLIQEARAVRAHYKGKICSDTVGKLIVALNEAEKRFYIEREKTT